MSDDEVIRFEITDYDLDNEFNFSRNRKAKKEHQIYGKCCPICCKICMDLRKHLLPI